MLVVLSLLAGAAPLLGGPVLASDLSDGVAQILREKLTTSTRSHRVHCRKELLCGPDVLHRFYTRRDFRPAWSVNTELLPQTAALMETVRAAQREGLRPEDYHLTALELLLAEVRRHTVLNSPVEPLLLADLDLLLTDTFLLYGSHLLTGHVNPETIQSEWLIKSRDADLGGILEEALVTNRIEHSLKSLSPTHPGYAALRDVLREYRVIETLGGWPNVSSGPTMERGDRGKRIRKLRSRLAASGDIDALTAGDPDVFDSDLKEAVRRFQTRHGLEVDGVVGRDTLRALNVPIERRLEQIRLNMERWRWLPHDLGASHIRVNIANFELDAIDEGQPGMTMRVVVGKRYRRTPVFTGIMTYLELNPFWHVPAKTAWRDILPHAQNDPQYLTRRKFRVFQSRAHDAPEILPHEID